MHWYKWQRRSSESGLWDSRWYQSFPQHYREEETSLPPVFYCDSQTCFDLVTDAGAIQISITVAVMSRQVALAVVCAGDWWLAQTAALLQNWSSATVAHMVVHIIPNSSGKRNSAACMHKYLYRAHRQKVMTSSILVPLYARNLVVFMLSMLLVKLYWILLMELELALIRIMFRPEPFGAIIADSKVSLVVALSSWVAANAFCNVFSSFNGVTTVDFSNFTQRILGCDVTVHLYHSHLGRMVSEECDCVVMYIIWGMFWQSVSHYVFGIQGPYLVGQYFLNSTSSFTIQMCTWLALSPILFGSLTYEKYATLTLYIKSVCWGKISLVTNSGARLLIPPKSTWSAPVQRSVVPISWGRIFAQPLLASKPLKLCAACTLLSLCPPTGVCCRAAGIVISVLLMVFHCIQILFLSLLECCL